MRAGQLFSSGAVLLLVLAAGCGDAPLEPKDEPAAKPREPVSQFDAAACGTIRGRVQWEGEIPEVKPFRAVLLAAGDNAVRDKLIRENPLAPIIGPKRGLRDAVVFLRGVDPKKARPWDLPPVAVEMRDYRFHVRQGEADSRFGFVRRGDPVTLVSRERHFHSVHADGAAFFSLTLPDPDQPRSRPLDEKGVVELSSGCGYYWMRAYLFVEDHPYFTRTDADGRFTLPQVPPGRCEVVCWLPRWHIARHERHPETGQIIRIAFCPPVELTRQVSVETMQTLTLTFEVTADSLHPPEPQ